MRIIESKEEEVEIFLNKNIGLTEEVADKFGEALRAAVFMSYRCDYGYAVVYGGFQNNQLQADLVSVDYCLEKEDICNEGHMVVPMYYRRCSIKDLKDKALGDVDELIEEETREAFLTFGAMYQDATVNEVLQGEKV